MSGRTNTGAEAIKLAKRDREAMRLRTTGMSLDAIAETLGWASRSGAHYSIAKQLQGLADETALDTKELRALEEGRLDKAQVIVDDIFDDGDPELRLKAVDKLIKISARRSKLRGLDAPKLLEVATMPDVSITILPPGGKPE